MLILAAGGGLLLLGILGLIVGVILLLVALAARYQAGLLAGSPVVSTADAAAKGRAVASPKGNVIVDGRVGCAAPLISPVTGTPCIAYCFTISATHRQGEQTKNMTIQEGKEAAPFTVDDGSGPVSVLIKDVDNAEMTEVFDKAQDMSNLGALPEALAFGKLTVATKLIPAGSRCQVTEQVLKPEGRVMVCGRVSDGQPLEPLILSRQTKDQAQASAARTSRITTVLGLVLSVGGIVALLIRHVRH